VWDDIRGFHPSADGLLNLLPVGEHGFARSRASILQSGKEGFGTASSLPQPVILSAAKDLRSFLWLDVLKAPAETLRGVYPE